MSNTITRKKSAWLIEWSGSRPEEIPAKRVLAFIDIRRGRAAIREMIFAIYLASDELLPSEKLSFAMNTERRRAMQKEDAVSLRCGFNPYVEARQVTDIEIERFDDGTSLVRWNQPVFNWVEAGHITFSHNFQREEKLSYPSLQPGT